MNSNFQTRHPSVSDAVDHDTHDDVSEVQVSHVWKWYWNS